MIGKSLGISGMVIDSGMEFSPRSTVVSFWVRMIWRASARVQRAWKSLVIGS